jgi:outer membrane immunogenic protein
MRNIQLSLAAAALLSLPLVAEAADIRRPTYRAATCTTCDWSGFYVGASLGVGQSWSTTTEAWNWTESIPTGTLVGTGGGPLLATTAPMSFSQPFADNYSHVGRGIIGGLQGGYNWQIGGLVVGVEGDYAWTSQSDTHFYSAAPAPSVFPPLPNFFFVPQTAQSWSSQQKLDWITTARGRLGWAHDSYLWYVTGGAAWAKVENNYALNSTPGNPGLSAAVGINGPGTFAAFGLPGGALAGSSSTTKVGWVLGGGVETNLGRLFGLTGNNWSMKLEYLYTDLGTVTNAIGSPLVPVCGTTCTAPFLVTGTAAFFSQNHVYEQTVRVGVNYRFNYAAVPIVTK